jgi:hypothetical protein
LKFFRLLPLKFFQCRRRDKPLERLAERILPTCLIELLCSVVDRVHACFSHRADPFVPVTHTVHVPLVCSAHSAYAVHALYFVV